MAVKKKRAHRTIPQPSGKPAIWRRVPVMEGLGVSVLFLLLTYFLATSWRKWPDPLIDFGRELYLPWRISHGALLYRDIEGHYGPLSQYFNGLLFTIFGPGLMILVIANLIIFAGILAFLYLICRRAWGPLGSFAACAILISIFGFSQLTGVSNYNYASPYAHETTHGMLVSLALTFVLCRWVRKPTIRRSLVAGLLYGLCPVLKPEFVLAGALAGVAAFLLRWRYFALPSWKMIACAALAAALPTLIFTAFFAAFVPMHDAFSMSTRAWFRLAATGAGGGASGIQGGFSGAEKAGSNLRQHVLATLLACGIIAAITGLGWLGKKISRPAILVAVTVATVGGLLWLSCSAIAWDEIGRCFLGLMLIYLGIHAVLIVLHKDKQDDPGREIAAILLAVLGIALMARMALNGRIYHYGFYQAAIAGCVLVAVLIVELPARLRVESYQRALVMAMTLALLLPGLFLIVKNSQSWLRMKTAAVGEGVDLFYSYPQSTEMTGELVQAAVVALKKEGKIDSLLVIPEGIMINYLTRIPSTVPYYFYAGTSPSLVSELEAKPPDRVVIISRDLREYGVERYGDNPGAGKELLDWLARDYRQYAHAGGNPLDVHRRGAVFFKRDPTTR